MKTMTISDKVRDFIMTASDADVEQMQFTIKYRQEAKRATVKRNMYVGSFVTVPMEMLNF